MSHWIKAEEGVASLDMGEVLPVNGVPGYEWPISLYEAAVDRRYGVLDEDEAKPEAASPRQRRSFMVRRRQDQEGRRLKKNVRQR